jgi:putative toxin-antitoxin system antitoxin component (TIGR02293 family)
VEWYETADALGGVKVLGREVVSGSSFVLRIEQGFPRKVVAEFKRYSLLSDADLSEVIPRRTLTNLKKAQRLSADQSDRMARVAGVTAFAQRVFGDAAEARAWLLTPNSALGNEAPLRMLRTGSGAQLVESVLTRIEHGVYE